MKFTKQGIQNRKEWKGIVTNTEFKISPIIQQFYQNNKLSSCEIKFLAYSQQYNIPNIEKRFKQFLSIMPKSKRKANTLENYILKYGKLGKQKYLNKNEKSKHTKENFISRHGNINGIKKYIQHNNRKSGSKQNFIRRYGKILGHQKYKEFCVKNSGNWSLLRQIEKHGEEEGLKRFKKNTEKISYSHSLEGYIKRHGEDLGTIMFFNKLKNLNKESKRGYSNISQEVFKQIYLKIKHDFKQIYFAILNKEFCVKQYQLDFFINDNKKCIEFYGDRFHANPSIYNESDTPNPFSKTKTAKFIWCKDEQRMNLLKENNIDVFIIWEKDYKQNKELTINKCLKFIYDK